jgi:hypothetical protein
VTRDLESLWADDPAPERRRSERPRPLSSDIWGDEDRAAGTEQEARAETTTQERVDLEEIWSRRIGPRPPPRTNGRRPQRTHRQRLVERRRRRRRRRIGLGIGGLFLLLLIADTTWAGLTLRNVLTSAESELQDGVAALQAGELGAAQAHFRRAEEGAGSASSGFSHPSIMLASVTPGLARDIDVTRALGDASELAARSGLAAVEMAEALGVTSDGFASSLYANGRVELDSLQEGKPFLDEIVGQLSEAQALLNDAPTATIGIIEDARRAAGGEISRANETAVKSSEMFGALPTLLGAEEKQRYFLAFQTLSEARGTGGLIGLWGILAAEDGAIELKKVAPIADLTQIPMPPASGPKWYETRYEPFASLEQWQQVNMTPNLPVASEVLLDMFENAKGRRLDGVVAMDPIALGMLSRGTGSLLAEGLDIAVSEDNARQVLLESVYEEFPGNNAQNTYLEALITEFWERISSADVDAPELIGGLGEAASSRHLQVYSSDDQAQEGLIDAEVAGTYDNYGPHVQMVFNNNLAASKVDYFLRRSINTNIVIANDGSAEVTTSIKLRNRAPSSDSALLDRAIESDPPGLNRLFLNAMLPQGAQLHTVSVGGEARPAVTDDEAGFPTVWDIVVLEAGDSTTMKVSYRLPNALDTSEGRSGMDWTLVPQATVVPDKFSVRVQAPDGFAASIEEERGGQEPAASLKGKLSSVRALRIQLERQ